jgi:ubiquinone/menaquinone biosynthesis C-methylase UbiE
MPMIEPVREHPSTYFVKDRSSAEEVARLEIQDEMLTKGQGGVLPELADPSMLRRVLDVGCGTGGWLMETAKAYPTIERLVGADISGKVLAHAQARAAEQGLGGRVQFQTMDALRLLEFPPGSFDLVNQRLGASWIRTWEWTKLLLEYQRVSRPGGIVRVTEMNALIESNSPALTKINHIVLEASYYSGRLFTASSDGVTGRLVHLMRQHGMENVQSRVHTLVFRAGTDAWQCFYADMASVFRVSLPFLQRWTKVPDDYQDMCEQALKEMRASGFVATWTLLTIWGTTPRGGKPMLMRGLR